MEPALIAVAPNGARRTKADHPTLPMTAAEIGHTAAACADAGAAMIHLHVRDASGRHSLDADLYRAAIATIRREAGERIIVQVTSEAAGMFAAAQQIAAIRALLPECVSVAPREIMPDEAALAAAGPFLAELARERVGVQYIIYSTEDVIRFRQLMARGLIPDARPFVLFVLGRYSKDQTSEPTDLLPFLAAWEQNGPFAVCAFGPKESACALAALALGGHARVGFENNLFLANGSRAPDNAALVAQASSGAALARRAVASARSVRQFLGLRGA